MTAPGTLPDAWHRWVAVLRGHGWGVDAVLRALRGEGADVPGAVNAEALARQ